MSDAIDLRELATIHNADNRDAFLSVYLDRSDPNHDTLVRTRIRQIRRATEDEEIAKQLEAGLERILSASANLEGSVRAIAGFVDLLGDFVRVAGFGNVFPTRVILDASPYIQPLAQHLDAYESYYLVLLDSQQAEVHLVEGTLAEEQFSEEHEAKGAHDQGGFSQLRFQAMRETIVQQYYDRIAEGLDRLLDEQVLKIVVAGPGVAKKHFVERLSKRAAEHVVAVEDLDSMARFSRAVQSFSEIVREAEEAEEQVYLARLRKAIKMTPHLTAMGIYEILEAAESGRIHTLLVRNDHSIAGRKDEATGTFLRRPGDVTESGSEGNEVDLVEEAIEACVRSSSHVEFTQDPYLHEVGGIAALLRW